MVIVLIRTQLRPDAVEVCEVTRGYEFGRTAPGVRTGDAPDA
jgi:hypothetical protein